MELVVFLYVIALILQLLVIGYSYRLFRLIKPLKYWTRAWGIFTASIALVFVRRVWSLIDLFENCPPSLVSHYVIEASILILVSGLWFIFVQQLKTLFVRYLNGDQEIKGHGETK